ncbi:hypothetical protein D043_4900B, partial [Vibrio parahaemolyticus EKP-021]
QIEALRYNYASWHLPTASLLLLPLAR